ncbi:MAG: CAP domain-containing protein [Myxococcota bacterium]
MTERYESRARVLCCALLVAGIAACEPGAGEGGPASSGRFVGDQVSFRLADGEASDFRFAGMECRVAHPLNSAVALCLVRAPGLPAGAVPVSGGVLAGQVEGVELSGTVGSDQASGTWRFEAACPDGTACVVDGVWTATRVADPVQPDATGDGGGHDVPVDVDAAPDSAVDGGPLGGEGDAIGPTPDVIVPEPTVPTSASAAQQEAATLLAEVRALIGLPMPEQIEGINAAAQAHAEYYVTHAAAYQSAGLSSHSENPDWAEGFTGESAGDRLKFQGVSAGNWAEVMAFSGTPKGAIDGWMDTLYHREPLVSPNLARWGFGLASAGTARAEVIDSINASTDAKGPAMWPVPNAVGVATRWNGFESPKPPLPPGESYPSGPVVTITFERLVSLKLSAASLNGPDGAAVAVQVQSPENDTYLDSTWALYAYSPLAAGTRYAVSFRGQVDGQEQTFDWSFTTK